MIDTAQMSPEQLELYDNLRLARAGILELDQWGYTKPIDPSAPNAERRRVVLFEVFRTPRQGPANAVASAALDFASEHDLSGIPHQPKFLGTLGITDEIINQRFSRE